MIIKATKLDATVKAEELDDISEDLQVPSLPPGGESGDAEGGANSQVDVIPSKAADITDTIPDWMKEHKKATALVTIIKTQNPGEVQKKAKNLAIIFNTWNPEGGGIGQS